MTACVAVLMTETVLVCPALVVPLRPEIQSHSVRTGLGSSFTHLIDEASLATGAGGVVICAIVWGCRDHISIAIDVDVRRGRPPPSET